MLSENLHWYCTNGYNAPVMIHLNSSQAAREWSVQKTRLVGEDSSALQNDGVGIWTWRVFNNHKLSPCSEQDKHLLLWKKDWPKKCDTYYNMERNVPVALSLNSRYLSWVTGTVERFVTTPLLTVLGMTAPVVPGSLPLLGQRWRVGAAPFSVGICRKSLTSWSQSKIRNTRRLFSTTVKHEESRVDLGDKEIKSTHNIIYHVLLTNDLILSKGTCNVAPAAGKLGWCLF